MPETLGDHIRRVRTKKGLGLRATARQVGISPAFLSRIERGNETAMPSEEVLRKLADVLEDDFDELMRLAGRISLELKEYVRSDPKMPEFLRQARARGLSADELLKLIDEED